MPTVLAVGLVLLGMVLTAAALSGGPTRLPPSGGPPLGAVLGEADRAHVAGPPVVRGAEAPPADPAVALHDPDAVVRAYLEAAHSVTADDLGSTHLRAALYAVPGTSPATVGVLVLDAPAPGSVRVAAVRAAEQIAADAADRRRGYLATVETRTGPPGGITDLARFTTTVVVARQPDGGWLVAAEMPENPDLPVGED